MFTCTVRMTKDLTQEEIDIDLEKVTSQKWGPSEWFGVDVAQASSEVRIQLAKDALLPSKAAERDCPYFSDLMDKNHTCSKAGGVCSVQRYAKSKKGAIDLDGLKVAICPSRLVTKQVLAQIAKKVLPNSQHVVLVKEVPYSLNMTKTNKNGEPAWAGRIDWLLVDEDNPAIYAAVETQSVYMSGKSQDGTFNAFIASAGALTSPPDYRHPDYKSSVPKRLSPQLESKARHLSSNARKTIVIVDEFVLANMTEPKEISVPIGYKHDEIRSEEYKLTSSQVIFAIVSLQEEVLSLAKLIYCTIDDAKAALEAVGPMSQAQFETVISQLVKPTTPQGTPKKRNENKVFKLF